MASSTSEPAVSASSASSAMEFSASSTVPSVHTPTSTTRSRRSWRYSTSVMSSSSVRRLATRRSWWRSARSISPVVTSSGSGSSGQESDRSVSSSSESQSSVASSSSSRLKSGSAFVICPQEYVRAPRRGQTFAHRVNPLPGPARSSGEEVAVRETDRESFESWARVSQQRLLRAAYLLTGDLYLAEDLLQEALV